MMTSPHYVIRDCYFNAHINQGIIFKALNLKKVMGSVAFNGFWEFGGENHTLADFMKDPADSHCWLEDEEGNIYDYCYEHYLWVAKVRTGSTKGMRVGEIRKVSHHEARLRGLTYKAASPDAQQWLKVRMLHNSGMSRTLGSLFGVEEVSSPEQMLEAVMILSGMGIKGKPEKCQPYPEPAVEVFEEEDQYTSILVKPQQKKKSNKNKK